VRKKRVITYYQRIQKEEKGFTTVAEKKKGSNDVGWKKGTSNRRPMKARTVGEKKKGPRNIPGGEEKKLLPLVGGGGKKNFRALGTRKSGCGRKENGDMKKKKEKKQRWL